MSSIWTQEQEAEHLHARFTRLKNETGTGQAEFARLYKIPGGASFLSQHIKNRRPINLEAATAYAKGFKCAIGDISPRLEKELTAANRVIPALDDIGEREIIAIYRKIEARDRDTLLRMARGFLPSSDVQKQKAA